MLLKYTFASLVVATVATAHAFALKQQVYPTFVYLTTSKVLLVILGNLALSLMLCFAKLVKVTFLGQLRESEVERLQERLKETIMEMCIAMTIFREEFSFSFIRYFSLLLFLKVFHWLSSDRVEFLETTPNITASQHVRCSSLIASLLLVDILFLREAIVDMTSQGPSVLLLFAFEYIILATGCIKLATKYVFYWIDKFYRGNWTGKSICVLYLDLVTELFMLAVYSIFFMIIALNFGLPFHLLRDLYMSFRSFRNNLVGFFNYRKLERNMPPDATAEDIGDSVCIICREEMVVGAAKKLQCGHCFHTNCLRSWLERQQTCPICRSPVAPQPEAQEAQADPQQAPPIPGADAGAGDGEGNRINDAQNEHQGLMRLAERLTNDAASRAGAGLEGGTSTASASGQAPSQVQQQQAPPTPEQPAPPQPAPSTTTVTPAAPAPSVQTTPPAATAPSPPQFPFQQPPYHLHQMAMAAAQAAVGMHHQQQQIPTPPPMGGMHHPGLGMSPMWYPYGYMPFSPPPPAFTPSPEHQLQQNAMASTLQSFQQQVQSLQQQLQQQQQQAQGRRPQDQNPTQEQVNQGEKSEAVNQTKEEDKEEEDGQVEKQEEETHQGVEPLYEGEEAVSTETVMADARDTEDEQESRGTPRSGSELRRRRLNRFQEEPL